MVALDGRASLVYAGGVEQLAAAGAGNGLLAGAVLTEAGVLSLGVRADGRDRDLVVADGARGVFGGHVYAPPADGTGPRSRPARA